MPAKVVCFLFVFEQVVSQKLTEADRRGLWRETPPPVGRKRARIRPAMSRRITSPQPPFLPIAEIVLNLKSAGENTSQQRWKTARIGSPKVTQIPRSSVIEHHIMSYRLIKSPGPNVEGTNVDRCSGLFYFGPLFRSPLDASATPQARLRQTTNRRKPGSSCESAACERFPP